MGEILTIDGGEESKKPREKYILDGISNFFRYGICSMKGWRKTMEDKFLIKLNIGPKKSTHIFGIFDGHGGREVSKFISDHFVEEFLKNENYEKGDIKTCLKETFLNLDKKLLEQSSMQEMTEDHFLFMQEFNLSEESEINIIEDNGYKYIEDISYTRGSAAIVLVIHNHTELYFANIGDSRGIIIRNGNNFVRMTNDHKPNNNDEKKRIKKAGSKILDNRINGLLNMSRSFGDYQFKLRRDLRQVEQAVSACPEITFMKRTKRELFIVLACDGVWDCANNSQIAQFFYNHVNRDPKKRLSLVIAELFNIILSDSPDKDVGTDNMTCILIQLKNPELDI
jgi:serine/threonine protein phosphatase PrpC